VEFDRQSLGLQASAHTPSVQNVAGHDWIDFAYRLNRQLVEEPMTNYPGRFLRTFADVPHLRPGVGGRRLST
jgi:hypothetical protein